MSRGPDAATLLGRALVAASERAGCPVSLAESDWTRWASATFTGARHGITLVGTHSSALDAWIAALPEAEFALHGHLVADLQLVRVRRAGAALTAEIEVLTVERR
ncbi:MAG: hypothetical protein J7500_15095 [Sphingomonas sp.]|uniref:hypothetical protein n=1 Tax=Sphingomonas sp. TaxID=28214 RepID=UPI001B183C11|nr:hypothetical protein [Sphingomonas sp.]MBO9624033.1 hypothetical protein [Sphingomonas sp.]